MSAHDPYEQHRAAFADELRRVAPKVRARRRRALALSGATIALAGAVTAAVVLAPTTGSRLDVLSEAQAAIDAGQDSILHYAITYQSDFPESDAAKKQAKGCKSGPMELWKATAEGPLRYRLRLPLHTCHINYVGRGRLATGAYDIAYADRTSKLYSARDGFMLVTTELPADADSMMPFVPPGDTRLTEGDPTDPVSRIRSLLAEGKLTDAGTLRGPDGRTLRRLVGHYTEMRGDPKAQKPWPVDVDYRVDADTFAPVTIKTKSRMSVPIDPNVYPGPTVHRRITDTTQFAIYETLPMTPENERLLTVDPTPGTDVSTRASDATTSAGKPSAAELARAKKITDAQIEAGLRRRADW